MPDESPPPPEVPSLRASNQDREQVAAVLQKAMSEGRITVAELESRLDTVYRAKTLADLAAPIADLPGQGISLVKPGAPLAAAARRPLVARSAGAPDKANLVGVMSNVLRKGSWIVPERINAVAVMGGVELDFSSAQLSGMETVMNVTAIMGGVEITVPEGLTVKVEGVGIMGAFEDHAQQTYGSDAPVLRIRGLALMGGVRVKSQRGAIG